MNVANEIEYIATDDEAADDSVRASDGRDGTVREYVVGGHAAEQIATGERRRMDCMDCHNRPEPRVAPTPERAVNEAMARGRDPGDAAVRPSGSREGAEGGLRVAGGGRRGNLPGAAGFLPAQPAAGARRAQDVDRAVRPSQDIYRRNVFPAMKVTFGSYPEQHRSRRFPGCFRCHDDEHKSKDGKKIGQDCETCHAIE